MGNRSDSSKKSTNQTFRSTILGQAIGKLLDNKSKTAIVKSVSPPALQQKKSSPNKSEQVKKQKLVKSSQDSDIDADVEDELSESDMTVISKPKLVQHRKSASSFNTSPEKGRFYFIFP